MRWIQALMLVASLGALSQLVVAQGQTGGLRGRVMDREFEIPVARAKISVGGTEFSATSDANGNWVLNAVPAGPRTIIITADGFQRQVLEVQVLQGALTDADVSLTGEFTNLDAEVIEEALQLGGGSEAGVLELRAGIDKILDGVSAEFLKKAGASDAGDALRLVTGASIGANDTAVIRGLPDRYVVTLLNGVRLPSADEETRAVQLDLFPSTIIDTLQVSKNFTPDQQADASGGALDIRLRTIPKDELFINVSSQVGFNTNSIGRDDFPTYSGGGLAFFGTDEGIARTEQRDRLNMPWLGGAGVFGSETPTDYKWSITGGGRTTIFDEIEVGGFTTFFYERDHSFDNEARDDSYELRTVGNGPLEPRRSGPAEEFQTLLYDVVRGSQSVQWGTFSGFGLRWEGQSIDFLYLLTRSTSDTATIRTNTRGKSVIFPGYDPTDPTSPGFDQPLVSPYTREDGIDYVERSLSSFQIAGRHVIPFEEYEIAGLFTSLEPEISWTLSLNESRFDQPNRRNLTARWLPADNLIPGFEIPAIWELAPPGESSVSTAYSIVFTDIEESSTQFSIKSKHPFKQWDDIEGYIEYGLFFDDAERSFTRDSYTGFGATTFFFGEFNEPLSLNLLDLQIGDVDNDVDYEGTQELLAGFFGFKLPLIKQFAINGGVRLESTQIGTQLLFESNRPRSNFSFLPSRGSFGLVEIRPEDTASNIDRLDILPAFGFDYRPIDEVVLRASYAQTIARPVFRELTPVLLEEFPGGPLFIGNPDLVPSEIQNYDLRADWTPYPGALVSVSWFRKDIDEIIEVVRILSSGFNYLGPINFPEGKLTGWEFEVRQSLANFNDALEGFSVGANATVISSKVRQPDSLIDVYRRRGFPFVVEERQATFAPDFLYNLFLNYENEETGTAASLFYTVQGDTLVEGGSLTDVAFIPDLYQRETGTLNFTLSQKFLDHFSLRFQAKNLLNPQIREVYRAPFLGDGGDVTKTSFTRGIDFSISLSAEFTF